MYWLGRKKLTVFVLRWCDCSHGKSERTDRKSPGTNNHCLKFAGNKFKMLKSVIFLYTTNEQTEFEIKNRTPGFPLWLSRLRTWLVSTRMWVWSLALLSGSKDLALLWPLVEVEDTAWTRCCCGCGVGRQLQFQFNP